MRYTKSDYNNEPVEYCSNCLSLSIKEINNSSLFVCGECGNVHLEEAHIDEWVQLYYKEYGKYFLSKEETEMEKDI